VFAVFNIREEIATFSQKKLATVRRTIHTFLMPKVTFLVAGQKREVKGQKGDTILKIALDAGIPMEAACGGMGFCGTCRCKVKESSHVSPMNDNERNLGITPPERLGCQTTVEGDVTVEMGEE